jgi:glycosyltransferase involved in cell wall biosynthesis
LQVVPRLDTGGSEQATVEITEALTRAGARALVATEGGRMATAIIQAGGEIIEFPMASKNPLTLLANARRLKHLIEDRNVNLVHARSRAPAWSAFFAARRTGRPFVTTYHGAYGNLGPLKAAYNSVMGRGDRVIANSRFTAGLIASRHHVAHDRIRMIYRGIDSATFDPLVVPPGPVAKLRESWGVSPKTKIVLQAARLTGLKGHRQTVEATARLNREGALGDAVVIFAGDALGKAAYRPGNPAALADRLRLALSLTPEQRAEIGGRASARASVEFALSQMQAKTLAVYDELLGKDLAEQFEQPPALDCLRQEDLESHSER